MRKLVNLIRYVIIFFSSFSQALDYQEYTLFHNSNHCSNYFDHFEQQHQIPKHLLRSISIVETGRWHSGAQIYLPWPWAINQGGKAYYFSSKKEAIEKVKYMLRKGLTNIDIGCMQINLHHHPEAFLDLNQAFEPRDNIAYAANFLIRNFKQSQNWQQAIAYYHSQAPIGKSYAKRVLKIWGDYNENKLHYAHCTGANGKVIPCNHATTENVITASLSKEKLPSSEADDTNYVVRPKKDLNRLRSAMISYSIHNE